jgi:hypothetical protein
MDNQSYNNNRLRNRYADLYTLLLENTLTSHTHTMETIQQIEDGIRHMSQNIARSEPTINEYDGRLHNRRPTSTRNTQHNTESELFEHWPSWRQHTVPAQRSRTIDRPVPRNHPINTHTQPNTIRPNRNMTPLFTTTLFNRVNYDHLTPVVVRPTPQQIANATESVIDFSQIENATCPIAQRLFRENDSVTRIRYCGHHFLTDHLNTWFTRSVICPVCRYDIRTAITQSNNDDDGTNDDGDSANDNDDGANNNDDGTNNNDDGTNNNDDGANNNDDGANNNDDGANDDGANDDGANEYSTRAAGGGMRESNDIQNLLNIFAGELSDVFTQQLLNSDLSANHLNNRSLNVEYTVQTPTEMFTMTSTSPTSLGDSMRNLRSRNEHHTSNERNNRS